MRDISLKKFPSFSTKDEPLFLTGVLEFPVVSINASKGITYRLMYHICVTKTYGCCLNMIFFEDNMTKIVKKSESGWKSAAIVSPTF